MAALLRHGAARRLGGSMVRQAEAVVADGRRRLGPRLMHTEEPAHMKVVREIQQKKEELYDVLTKVEMCPETRNWHTMWLHQHLSVEITPRPHDPVWCHVQSARRVTSVIKKAGLVYLTYLVASCCSEYC
uniref:Uncharacterized protein n=1 Tax=Avena sativa TaxID=4498 RepID=A0ACD5U369_AVESA